MGKLDVLPGRETRAYRESIANSARFFNALIKILYKKGQKRYENRKTICVSPLNSYGIHTKRNKLYVENRFTHDFFDSRDSFVYRVETGVAERSHSIALSGFCHFCNGTVPQNDIADFLVDD